MKVFVNCTDGSTVEYGTAEFRKKLANGEVTNEEARRCLNKKIELSDIAIDEWLERRDELGWEEYEKKDWYLEY